MILFETTLGEFKIEFFEKEVSFIYGDTLGKLKEIATGVVWESYSTT